MTSSKSLKKPNENSSKTQIDLLIRESVASLSNAGVDAPRTDVLALLEHVLDKERTWILAHQDDSLTNEQYELYNSYLTRRINREPLAYILGSREFYGLQIMTTADVLIPRPETEALVEWIITNAPEDSSMIDVGTGSGCIAIAVQQNRPDMEVVASDVSDEALQIAKNNSGQNETNIKFVHSDLLNYITNSFDIIAANLPYVPKDEAREAELANEPSLALHSGADGLDHYRPFLEQAPTRLKKNGAIIIEHDPKQLEALTQLAKDSGFKLESHTRFVSVLYLEQ